VLAHQRLRWLAAGLVALASCASADCPPACGVPPAENPELVTKWPGWLFLGDYEAQDVTRLCDLPDDVQQSLQSHLNARLGRALATELVLAGGQLVDRDALLLAEPDAAQWEWEIPAYRLFFRLERPDAGLEAYYAEISLDAQGRVIEEIDLPAVAAQGGELQLVPLETARMAVRALGHLGDLPAEIAYRPDLDTLVWIITPDDTERSEGVMQYFQEVVVDGRDGHVVECLDREAIE